MTEPTNAELAGFLATKVMGYLDLGLDWWARPGHGEIRKSAYRPAGDIAQAMEALEKLKHLHPCFTWSPVPEVWAFSFGLPPYLEMSIKGWHNLARLICLAILKETGAALIGPPVKGGEDEEQGLGTLEIRLV